jgi:hypothetical protein
MILANRLFFAGQMAAGIHQPHFDGARLGPVLGNICASGGTDESYKIATLQLKWAG